LSILRGPALKAFRGAKRLVALPVPRQSARHVAQAAGRPGGAEHRAADLAPIVAELSRRARTGPASRPQRVPASGMRCSPPGAGAVAGMRQKAPPERGSRGVVFRRSLRGLVRSMVFVGLPPGTAELVVTTIYVFVVIITLPAIRGGEGGHTSHGRKSDRDDKKRSHESLSRLHPKGERRPVRGWMAPT
jgi:hypothetical protein